MTTLAFVFSLLVCQSAAHAVMDGYALSLFSEPKYKPGFTHFDYTNPDAPKGGAVRLAYPITFDSMNPFILKGLAAPGIGMIYDTLMVASLDEPQVFYPLIAKRVDLAEDRHSITFTLDPRARFHDGTPVTAEDVMFSFNVLKEKGHPVYQLHYREIERAEVVRPGVVRFVFASTANRDLPFTAASLPVLPRAFYEGKEFDRTSLEFPLASGPYRVSAMDAGRSITYSRVEDYWARDLPSRKGMFNFDSIRYDVYRDETVAIEAFKAREYDLREEYIARNWALSYRFPAVKDGRVVIDETPHKIPRGMQAFIFNLRKPKFADRRVREAIALTFDFEWMNRTLFYGAYSRNDSFFQNTDFSAVGEPSEGERSLLEPYREALPPGVFDEAYKPPVSDGSGFIRERLIQADTLLKEAGWVVRDGKRVHADTGEVLSIEFLARQRSLEKLVMAMRRNLKVLGIEVRYRDVDESQYQKRWQTFDFDITTIWWNQGLLFPGNEQQSYWSCAQANVEGSQNLSGYCSPVVDDLLGRISAAQDYETLQPAARALDRVLLREHVVIPHFSISHFRMAYWDMFGIPEVRPDYDRGFDSWWMKQEEGSE